MWSCRQLITLACDVQVECEVAHISLSLRELFKGKMNSVLQILRNCSTPPLQNSLSACSHSVARKRELPISAFLFCSTPFYRLTVIAWLSRLEVITPSAPKGERTPLGIALRTYSFSALSFYSCVSMSYYTNF